DLSEEERNRQISFLEFETQEIEAADLAPGEDAKLEKEYKKMQNARKIVVSVGRAHELTGYDSENGAGEVVGLAVRELESAAAYDEDVSELLGMLTEIESLLGDFNRSAADYLDGLVFAEEAFAEIEERLDLINHLKSKYGRTVDDILAALLEKQAHLAELKNYEENRKKLKSELSLREKELKTASEKLTEARKRYAESFAADVAAQLKDLNFARADFAVSFGETKGWTAGGHDTVTYMIATNPGENRRALNKVVSGGELSRIMLGIKTMFASEDRTGTLIFDEVDTGISGRTAQKVAEKMAVIAMNRQVLCITHLPQIAAMADTHYGITKDVTDGSAVTRIDVLDPKESVDELARLLGGAEITQNTQKTATEMQEMCRQYKKNALKC
ncbi:MAG: DNA repair protein RecN, partial [Lachnospiraceae bacterium]|nr:DNA repair protein RecN [Lachnospiraceae bacterium]